SSPGGYERKPSNGYGAPNSVSDEGQANYDFSYSVVDEESGSNYGHSQSSDGTITKGTYFVQLPDGRTQRVDYTVNGDSGFVATVTYEGEAHSDTSIQNNVQDQYGPPSQPQYGPPPQPEYGAPSQPEYGPPLQPEYGAPSQPEYGPPPQQGYGSPAQPEYNAPVQPEYGAPAPIEYGPPQPTLAPRIPLARQYNSQPILNQPQYG
ncbi:unnamed protein product, partial [Meganyctiphanes norvegica]